MSIAVFLILLLAASAVLLALTIGKPLVMSKVMTQPAVPPALVAMQLFVTPTKR